MSTSENFNKVIVILGPTGSGKTGVAIEIAREIGGEIISADSRAIYKGMDIGTAKPTREEQALVPHWGLDLVESGERFTVADWKEYAEGKIKEIRGRGHVPMVVGGTGLYIDALVYDYQFGAEDKSSSCGRSSGLSSQASSLRPHRNCGCPQELLLSPAPDRQSIDDDYLLIGIKTEAEKLRKRLTERVNKLFAQELYDETHKLVDQYGWDNQAMKSNIYQFAWRFMQGEIDLDTAKKLCVYDDWHLAKRQMTWFKRTPQIIWLELANVKAYVLKYIQDE